MTIYVVGAESSDLVKIGYTGGDPRTRLAQLQTGQPQQLYLLWSCAGGRDLERALHSRFAPYRSRGEWFDLTRLGDPRKAIREAVSELTITRVPAEVNKTRVIGSEDDRASQGPDSDDEWEIWTASSAGAQTAAASSPSSPSKTCATFLVITNGGARPVSDAGSSSRTRRSVSMCGRSRARCGAATSVRHPSAFRRAPHTAKPSKPTRSTPCMTRPGCRCGDRTGDGTAAASPAARDGPH